MAAEDEPGEGTKDILLALANPVVAVSLVGGLVVLAAAGAILSAMGVL